jgi:hypothetical protein
MCATLASGPMRHEDEALIDIWHAIRFLVRHDIRIIVQFVYGHCKHPRGDAIDTAAKAAAHSLARAAPVWLDDFVAAARRHLESLRNEPPSHRQQLLGGHKRKLLTTTTRATSTDMARLRCGEHLHFGTMRRRLLLDLSASCRWCCPLSAPTLLPFATVPHEPLPLCPDELAQCPYCPQQSKRQTHYKRHWEKVHQRNPAQPYVDLYHTTCSICALGPLTAQGLINHRKICGVRPRAQEHDMHHVAEGEHEETLQHLLFHCHATAGLRTQFADLLALDPQQLYYDPRLLQFAHDAIAILPRP